MDRRDWLLVGGVIFGVIILAAAVMLWAASQFRRESYQAVSNEATPSSLSTPLQTVSSVSPTDADCPSSSGTLPLVQATTANQRPEPYTHTTWLVQSADGVNLTVAQKLLEHASVPEIVRALDGKLLVYAVDFSEATGNGQERLVVVRSKDGGTTWTTAEPICLEGKTTTGAAVDPSVVTLPDGRFRLYYFGFGPPAGSTAKPDPSAGHKFYSAISDDGMHFTEEEGVRFQGQNITDPEVVQLPDGSFLMYISRGQETLIASSPDGLTFTDTGRTLAGGGVPGAVVLEDGTVRWYGCSQGGIVTATAKDGLVFEARQTVSLTPKPTDPVVCDPAVVRLPDGTFVGVIKTAPSQGTGPSGQTQPQSSQSSPPR